MRSTRCWLLLVKCRCAFISFLSWMTRVTWYTMQTTVWDAAILNLLFFVSASVWLNSITRFFLFTLIGMGSTWNLFPRFVMLAENCRNFKDNILHRYVQANLYKREKLFGSTVIREPLLCMNSQQRTLRHVHEFSSIHVIHRTISCK